MPRITRNTVTALLTAALALTLVALPATAGAAKKKSTSSEAKQNAAIKKAGDAATKAVNGLGDLKKSVPDAITKLSNQVTGLTNLVSDANGSKLPRGGVAKLAVGQATPLLTSGPITISEVCENDPANPGQIRARAVATSTETGSVDGYNRNATFGGAVVDTIATASSNSSASGTSTGTAGNSLIADILTPSGFDINTSGNIGVNALGAQCYGQVSAFR